MPHMKHLILPLSYLGSACFALLLGLLCGVLSGGDLAFASPAFKCTASIDGSAQSELVAAIEKQYTTIDSLEAKFEQRSYVLAQNRETIDRGTVAFRKPGKMNWEYQAPNAQSFITDGTVLWYFQPQLNQVELRDFTRSFQSDLPVSFLLGIGRLSESFTLKSACRSTQGVIAEFLAKRAESNLQEFSLLVDPATHTPLGARIIDVGGNETEILFASLQTNTAVSESKFTFEIPKGTDIIDSRNKSRVAAELSTIEPADPMGLKAAAEPKPVTPVALREVDPAARRSIEERSIDGVSPAQSLDAEKLAARNEFIRRWEAKQRKSKGAK